LTNEIETLGDALPKEQARVRELIKIYAGIGPGGMIAITMMEIALQKADQVIINGDVVEMLRVYEELKGFKE